MAATSWEQLFSQGTLTHEMTKIDAWMSDFIEGKSKTKALLLLGPCGCGKTTVAKLALKKWNYMVHELYAFHTRNKKYMNEQLDLCLVNSSLMPTARRAVLVDSIESMLPSESQGLTELVKYVSQHSVRKKRTVVQTSHDVPIVCICNPGNHKKDMLTHLKAECHVVEFGNHVKEVCEHLRIDEVDRIVALSGPSDVRKALQTINLLNLVKDDSVMTILGSKHETQYIVKAVQTVLDSATAASDAERLTPLQLQGMFAKDKSKFLPMMHENYYHGVTRLQTAVRIARLFTYADIMDHTASLQTLHAIACVHCPCSIISQDEPKTNRGIGVSWARLLQVRSQSQNVKKSLVELSNTAFPTKLASVWEVQHAIAVTISLLLCERYDQMAAYASSLQLIASPEELKDAKDPLEALRKLNKFIKLHPLYGRFTEFCLKNKLNKALAQRLRAAFRAQDIKAKLQVQAQPQLRAADGTSASIVQRSEQLAALFS